MTLLPPLPRRVEPETLDYLAENDPRAIRSRRDLQRVHRVMRTRGILLRALRQAAALAAIAPQRAAPLRLIELGAGDATLMLGVARTLARQWPHVALTVLDRQRVVAASTLDAYRALGWQVEVMVMDVAAWAAMRHAERWDVALANLFLHHFDDDTLAGLLDAVAANCRAFVACEPRRSRFALAGSHLIGALGVNAVTREDAVLSVRAGFRERELSALWRHSGSWQLMEYAAPPFSHCLVAADLENPP